MFGLFELPPIWPEDRTFSDQVLSVHGLVGLGHRGLLAAHTAPRSTIISCADGILMRMITG